jgi:hypothetical protein
MPIVEDRLKSGTLTLDALPFATQATNVNLEPKTDEEGDQLEVLSGDTIEPDDVTTWTLNITAIQDFDDEAGFVEFCRANAGDVVPFSWRPNAAGVTYAGDVKIRPVTIGGDVNARLTTGAAFPLVGDPDPTYPV